MLHNLMQTRVYKYGLSIISLGTSTNVHAPHTEISQQVLRQVGIGLYMLDKWGGVLELAVWTF